MTSSHVNDVRTINCKGCGECAVEVDPALTMEELDGREDRCPGCKLPGAIVACDDEGACWVEFRPKKMNAGYIHFDADRVAAWQAKWHRDWAHKWDVRSSPSETGRYTSLYFPKTETA